MTTNQTIDGVPLLPCPFCGGEPYGTHDHYVHDDLSPMPCVECRSCSAHLKAGDWNRRVKPAAQPQGEPFAWWCWNPGMGPNGTDAVFVSASHPREQIVENHSWNKVIADQPLYAEQPAPVTVVMRCSFCDVVNEHGSPWSCHSESVDGNLVYRVIGCKDHTHLVDACLDELKRLNPSL